MPLPLFAIPAVKAAVKGAKNVLGKALEGARVSGGNALAGNFQRTTSFGTSTQKPELPSDSGEAKNYTMYYVLGGLALLGALVIFKKK